MSRELVRSHLWLVEIDDAKGRHFLDIAPGEG